VNKTIHIASGAMPVSTTGKLKQGTAVKKDLSLFVTGHPACDASPADLGALRPMPWQTILKINQRHN